jgi:hypothetical protein
MKKTLVKSLAALAALASLPAAANWATYSGSSCQTRAGSQELVYYFSGRAINDKAAAVDAVCPLQRNITSTFNEDASVRVTVLDAHYSENVCCTAYVREADGGTLAGSAQVCSSGSDTSVHKVLSLDVPAVFAGTNGFLVLNCNIPGTYNGIGSALASIEVVE